MSSMYANISYISYRYDCVTCPICPKAKILMSPDLDFHCFLSLILIALYNVLCTFWLCLPFMPQKYDKKKTRISSTALGANTLWFGKPHFEDILLQQFQVKWATKKTLLLSIILAVQ